MGDTKIEWVKGESGQGKTWNPLRGCTPRGPGCLNCYAARMAARFNRPGEAYDGLAVQTPHGPQWTNVVRLVPDKLTEPLHWRKPTTCFVNSMSDLFHDAVPVEYIDRVFAVMALTRQHTYQILTKRPERMREYLTGGGVASRIGDAAKAISAATGAKPSANVMWIGSMGPFGDRWILKQWPLLNVWMGPSVCIRKHLPWLDEVRNAPIAVRMISFEPLLEDLGTVDLAGFHWCITGGESGPKARPSHPDWFRSLRDQAQAAGVPFFFKQWGEHCHPAQMTHDTYQRVDAAHNLAGHGRYSEPWRVGKKDAGRELDGKVWDQMPATAHATE